MWITTLYLNYSTIQMFPIIDSIHKHPNQINTTQHNDMMNVECDDFTRQIIHPIVITKRILHWQTSVCFEEREESYHSSILALHVSFVVLIPSSISLSVSSHNGDNLGFWIIQQWLLKFQSECEFWEEGSFEMKDEEYETFTLVQEQSKRTTHHLFQLIHIILSNTFITTNLLLLTPSHFDVVLIHCSMWREKEKLECDLLRIVFCSSFSGFRIITVSHIKHAFIPTRWVKCWMRMGEWRRNEWWEWTINSLRQREDVQFKTKKYQRERIETSVDYSCHVQQTMVKVSL